jgi:hypothetical protein
MAYMTKEKANSLIPGRQTRYKIPDIMGEGMNSFIMEKVRSDGLNDYIATMDTLEDEEVEDNSDFDV